MFPQTLVIFYFPLKHFLKFLLLHKRVSSQDWIKEDKECFKKIISLTSVLE